MGEEKAGIDNVEFTIVIQFICVQYAVGNIADVLYFGVLFCEFDYRAIKIYCGNVAGFANELSCQEGYMAAPAAYVQEFFAFDAAIS